MSIVSRRAACLSFERSLAEGASNRMDDGVNKAHTVVSQELFNEIDMSEDHSAATVPLESQVGQCITVTASERGKRVIHRGKANPSVTPSANNRMYSVHLSPTTFPHVKQRTGII